MYARVEVISPADARHYLGMNESNYRKPEHERIATYASDMKSGRWQLNGEAVKITKGNKLVDGQHRLMAVIEAGVPVEMLVCHDVDDDTYIFDSGKSRTIQNVAFQSGLVGCVGGTQSLSACGYIVKGRLIPGRITSRGEIIEFASSHAQLIESALKITSYGTGHPICLKAPITVACMAMLLGCWPSDLLRDFFSIVNTGFPIDGKESSPAIVFRNMLIGKNAISPRSCEGIQLLFSSCIDAASDFANGVKRRNAYKLNETTIQAYFNPLVAEAKLVAHGDREAAINADT